MSITLYRFCFLETILRNEIWGHICLPCEQASTAWRVNKSRWEYYILRKMLKRKHPEQEILSTVLIEIVLSINSIPSVQILIEPTYLQILGPNGYEYEYLLSGLKSTRGNISVVMVHENWRTMSWQKLSGMRKKWRVAININIWFSATLTINVTACGRAAFKNRWLDSWWPELIN